VSREIVIPHAPSDRYTVTLQGLRRRLWATHAGLWAERLTHAFWPLWSVAISALGLLMLGLQDLVAVEWVVAGAAVFALGGAATLWAGLRAFHAPTRTEALDRIDARLKGRPLQTLRDSQAVGEADDASRAVWAAHQARMAARAETAAAVPPDLRVARRDPFALRYVAALVLAVALLFGSLVRVGSVTEMGGGAALAAGPAWEGWIEPPAYTGLPTLYLSDQPDSVEVLEGSRVTLRLYGAVGDLSVTESVSARIGETEGDAAPVSDSAQEFSVAQAGAVAIEGPGGRAFDIALLPDDAPTIARAEGFEVTAGGQMSLPFRAQDDFGVRDGTATIALDLDALDRRYSFALAPEPRAPISLPLPMPLAGGREEFVETLIENFSEHPWSNLPVTVSLEVADELGQASAPLEIDMPLPGRRFFDPLAAALIDQRQALLWSRESAPRVSQVLRAISHQPDGIFRSATAYLRMSTINRRLETFARYGMTEEQRDEISQALWDLAILLEDGDLDDALARLQRAQERLDQATRNGASEQEIAELMQELREATDDYLRQLTQQAQRDFEQGERQPGQQAPQDGMQMTQNDLQEMMDRIQELMEQGRMAEAQEALRQLQEMMENMQVTQGQPGQGQQSPGQQAMEGLAETLRDQQGLSDQAFRDLQDRFNPDNRQGQQGQPGQPGEQGQQGQQPGQQPGQGQQGQSQPGQGQGQGQGGNATNEGQSLEGTLADRQQALREELERQRGNLPGSGSEAGEAARQALDEADEAMRGAEDALRRDDLAEAIDEQSNAMEALREGMRNLGEAMAQEQQGQGQQGNQQAGGPSEQADPLGRAPGNNGAVGSEEQLLQGEDVYRRARELLDEIRRRTGDGDRPEVEREYLERLLDRF
jgi:uncharacterized protein (TIGR02302 family)